MQSELRLRFTTHTRSVRCLVGRAFLTATADVMFARTSARMGSRFASGNVYYMGRTFTSRHLHSVASPLSTGFVSSLRFSSSITGRANAGDMMGTLEGGLGSEVIPLDDLLASCMKAALEVTASMGQYGTTPILACRCWQPVLSVLCDMHGEDAE
jgi:hypothetical protein